MQMERDFLTDEQSLQLVKFAEVMATQGHMRRISDNCLIAQHMSLNGVIETPVEGVAKHKIVFFNDETWCWLVVRHCGHQNNSENGLCALCVDKKYLRGQFAPGGVQNPHRMKTIIQSMLAILNVDPAEVDLDKMAMIQKSSN